MRTTQYSRSEYYYCSSQKRNKTDWAGIGIADAYKPNLDYQTKIPAQKKLLAMVKKARRLVQKVTEKAESSYHANAVKMQLGPFFTNYPSIVAAHASIGLTCYLQYKQDIPERLLQQHLKELKEDVIYYTERQVDTGSLDKMVTQVVNSVQSRLILEELSHNNLGSIEIYRLFAASQNDLKFLYLDEIINSVILFGDVLPSWKNLDLHKTTADIFRAIHPVSIEYSMELAETDPSEYLAIGLEWTTAICEELLAFLPSAEPVSSGEGLSDPRRNSQRLDDMLKNIPPLEKKQPPSLYNQEDIVSFIQKNMAEKSIQGGQQPKSDSGEQNKSLLDKFNTIAEALSKAGSQQSNWEDMRSDVVERALRRSVFNPGPIEGNPSEGHEVSLDFGGNEKATGEIFDRPLELSDDIIAHEELLNDADPIIKEMRKVLYPNNITIPEKERLCTSGSLDGSRLPLAEFSQAVFKRYHNKEVVDKGGKPVLLIACDGSGSLNAAQIKLLKLLTAAWIHSTLKNDIQVISGIYHSGEVRKGLHNPLIQWIYHPRKTPAISLKEASRAIISLPASGTGCQSDSLSIAFMVNEAASFAKGRMIYMIMLTDCAWNQSFRTEKNGHQEMEALFDNFSESFGDKLNTTLIGLGVNQKQPLFDKLKKVILINNQELDAPLVVAKKINLYVAKCLKERKQISTRK